MDKYLFLDIDGVLNVWGEDLSHKQELLYQILDTTGAKIVVSSSWRCSTVEETIEAFKEHGFTFTDHIVGVTIRAYHYITQKIHLSIPRGVEIKQWIDTHVHSKNGKEWDSKQLGKDYNYIILDDDDDMLLEHQNHFIHCKHDVGLTPEEVQRAIQILNN